MTLEIIVELLIEVERELRATKEIKGHVRLADKLNVARRALQERAGLVLSHEQVEREIPEPIARLLPNGREQRMRMLMEGIVIGAFTQRLITRGRAGELLGFDDWKTEQFFAERGIAMNYDLQEFQRDLKTPTPPKENTEEDDERQS